MTFLTFFKPLDPDSESGSRGPLNPDPKQCPKHCVCLLEWVWLIDFTVKFCPITVSRRLVVWEAKPKLEIGTSWWRTWWRGNCRLPSPPPPKKKRSARNELFVSVEVLQYLTCDSQARFKKKIGQSKTFFKGSYYRQSFLIRLKLLWLFEYEFISAQLKLEFILSLTLRSRTRSWNLVSIVNLFDYIRVCLTGTHLSV